MHEPRSLAEDEHFPRLTRRGGCLGRQRCDHRLDMRRIGSLILGGRAASAARGSELLRRSVQTRKYLVLRDRAGTARIPLREEAVEARLELVACDRTILITVHQREQRRRRTAAAAAAAGCLRRCARGRRRCLLSQPAAGRREHGEHRRAADHERGQRPRTLQFHTSSSPSTWQRCSPPNKPTKTRCRTAYTGEMTRLVYHHRPISQNCWGNPPPRIRPRNGLHLRETTNLHGFHLAQTFR